MAHLIRILCVTLVLGLSATLHAQSSTDELSTAISSYNAGYCTEAIPLLEKILKTYKMNNEQRYSLTYYAGYCARDVGNLPLAYGYMSSALDLALGLGETEQIPMLNMFLADIQREQGMYKEAIDRYTAVTKLVDPESAELATVYYFLAETYRLDGNYTDGIGQCELAMAIARKQRLVNVETACLTSIGETHSEAGNYPQAIKVFTDAMTIAYNAPLPLEMANINVGLAKVYEKLDKKDLARQQYDEALKFYMLCMTVTNIQMIADRLMSLPAPTKAWAERAAVSYQAYSETLSAAQDEYNALYLRMLVAHYQLIAENAGAAETYREVLSLAIAYRLPLHVYMSATRLADLLGEMDLAGAIEVLTSAEQYETQQTQQTYLAMIHAEKGKHYAAHKQKKLAEASYQKAVELAKTDEERAGYTAALAELANMKEAPPPAPAAATSAETESAEPATTEATTAEPEAAEGAGEVAEPAAETVD
jgi:tetratricopeptide (TPR) repeat protein